MADVVLVWPQTLLGDPILESLESRVMPLGLAYLAGALNNAQYSVKAIDMVASRMDLTDILKICSLEQPRMVGISCTTLSYGRAKAVAAIIRGNLPTIPIIMGGPHVTFAFQKILKSGVADIVVHGEGEVTIIELARFVLEGRGSLDQIKGISFLHNGKIVTTPPRPFIKELDSLPTPARHLFPWDSYVAQPIANSRGCPYHCMFCSAGAMAGGNFRLRAPEKVVDEIVNVRKQFSTNKFMFIDDTLTAIPARTTILCKQLIEKCPGITWKCESAVASVDANLLNLMGEAGCDTIQFGAESGDDRILKIIGKGLTRNKIKSAVSLALVSGIKKVVVSFIIGHPSDDGKSVNKTLAFIDELKGLGNTEAQVVSRIGVLVPFPGTEIQLRAKELGIKILCDDWETCAPDDIMIETAALDANALRSFYFQSQVNDLGRIHKLPVAAGKQ